MAWTNVLAVSALPTGTRQVVKINNQAILLLHHNDQIYAVANACPHMKLPLAKGTITEDNAIVCPWHRSAFDLCSGAATTWTPWPPGVGKVMAMLSQEKALPVFPVRTEDGHIWVDLDSAPA